MAMLLFMVCAVLGGIILASATAAGGRVTNLVDSDKRYYSVTSTAQLLAKEIEAKQVVIERTKTYTEVTGPDGVPTGGESDVEYAVKTVESKNQSSLTFDNYSYLAKLANYLLFGENANDSSVAPSEKWNKSFDAMEIDDEATVAPESSEGSFRTKTGGDFVVRLYAGDAPGEPDAALSDVTCHSYIQTDGTMVINLQNNDTTDTYKLRLVLKPDYTESQTNQELSSVAVAGTEETQFVTRKKITKTSTISWSLSNVKKVE